MVTHNQSANRVKVRFIAMGIGNELVNFNNQLHNLLKPHNVQSGSYEISPAFVEEKPAMGKVAYRLTFHNNLQAYDVFIAHLVSEGYAIIQQYEFILTHRADGTLYKVPQTRLFKKLTEFKAKELNGKRVTLHCPRTNSDNKPYTFGCVVGDIVPLIGARSGKVRGKVLADAEGKHTGVMFDVEGDAWCFDEIYAVYVSI